MKKLATALVLASSTLAFASAHADVGFGFGATWVFGTSTGAGLAVGPKLFSTDEEDKVAASLGVDYVINSSSFRPNIGISYLLKDDVYTDLNVGYNLKSKAVDFGFAVGYTETEEDKIKAKPATPELPAPTSLNNLN